MVITFIKEYANISNKKISEILQTSPSFITSISKGERKLNTNHIEKIFKAIDFSEEEKEKILLEFYLEDAPSDFKEKILQKINS